MEYLVSQKRAKVSYVLLYKWNKLKIVKIVELNNKDDTDKEHKSTEKLWAQLSETQSTLMTEDHINQEVEVRGREFKFYSTVGSFEKNTLYTLDFTD